MEWKHKSKCHFFVKSLEYIGFRIDGGGIHKTDDKVNSAKEPENVRGLQSFLGLVTFYGKFVKNLATFANPLYNLTAKVVPWNWSVKCQEVFHRIKAEITDETFLLHYNKICL